jgi:hypothetical protein
MTLSSARKMVSRLLRKDVLYPTLDRLGIPRLSGASGFHAFRHSVGSFINTQTGNLKLAQNLLGHSTINMTANVYTHVSMESEREAAQAVERAIYGDLLPICSQSGEPLRWHKRLGHAWVTEIQDDRSCTLPRTPFRDSESTKSIRLQGAREIERANYLFL